LLTAFIVIILVSLTLILRTLGVSPFSSGIDSGNPTNHPQAQNSLTTQISSPTSQVSSALGKADKLAFVKSSEIWVSNLDGSDLIQLTTDRDKKSNPHWSPDGQSVIYTSASCLNLVGLLTRQVLTLTCFADIPAITAFDISPNGQNVALGLAQSDLYLVPYTQLFNLPRTSHPVDLTPLAQCSNYAPYNTKEILKGVNWSFATGRLALLLSTLVDGILRDEISILDFDQCTASPLLIKEIPPTYFLFTFPGYFEHPEISGLSWNGNDQLLLNNNVNNAGFGDLQLYNLERSQSKELSPVGACCYRDARWSPDGTYLLYSFQPEAGGDISLYYTPSTELSKPGTAMASLSLPAGFLNEGVESLQPALRTAH